MRSASSRHRATAALALGLCWPLLTSAKPAVVEAPTRAPAAPPAAVQAVVTPAPAVAAPVPRSVESVQWLTLRSAPFPARAGSNTLAFVPAGLDRRVAPPVIVFVHGWHGCIASVVSDVAIPCRPDGPHRAPLGLLTGMRASGVPAVLLVPQMAMERPSSDPGRFAEPGALRRYLDESLAALAPSIGAHTVDELPRVVLASHSAGSETAVRLLAHGDVPVDAVAFFDSFYVGKYTLLAWMRRDPSRFTPEAARPMRFVSVYRGDGDVAVVDREFASLVRDRLPEVARGMRVRDEVARATADEARAPVALLRVPGNHAETVQQNLAPVLQGLLAR